MLVNPSPEERADVVVARWPIEVVLAEEGATPLSLVLPPLEDLMEMRALQRTHFSLSEYARSTWAKFEGLFRHELNVLEKKAAQFSDSPTFLNHLANFAELGGDREREGEFLALARERFKDDFFEHRVAENLIARNKNEEAERVFRGMDLTKDISANLRLAYFHVQRREIDKAVEAVARAVEIDPLHFGSRLFEGALRLITVDYRAAIHSFRVALEERPNSSVVHANIAVAYVFLRRPEKALVSLRRSVALDPLNKNAITLLADLSYNAHCNEDAVPALRYFLGFEQKDASVWARLARALLELGEVGEAIAALKRQGSIEDTSAVWNNLGVAYYRRGDKRKALESYKYAMEKDSADPTHSTFMAARNVALMFNEFHDYKSLLKLTLAVIAEDKARLIPKDKLLCSLYMFFIQALSKTGQREEAVRFSENILNEQNACLPLKAWIVGLLLGRFAYSAQTRPRAIELARKVGMVLLKRDDLEEDAERSLANNMAVVFAEDERLEEAESFLPYLSRWIHRTPYQTATLGLIHMRKGHVERAMALYEEAIRLAISKEDKTRIRQKLNYELGRAHLEADPSRARRYLEKVINERDGEEGLVEAGKVLQKQLRNF